MDHSHYSPTIGIKHSPSHVSQFIENLASSPRSEFITFTEFRNFLLFLPRKPSPAEIYQYYNVRRHIVHEDSAANVEGPSQPTITRQTLNSFHSLAGASPSSKDQTLDFATVSHTRSIQRRTDPLQDDVEIESDEDDEENEPHSILAQNSSLKFLLAGGISGAGDLSSFEVARDS
jgi:solute carrier family 25 (mitochondrial phosphate transporter), member 23/24/25/41